MTYALAGVLDDYASALRNYLEESNEASLHRAYELGRKAMRDGIGVLDMAATHSRALASVLEHGVALDQTTTVVKAGEFLAESLAAFEMAHRGYKATNEVLDHLNDNLRQRTAELEAVNRELEAFSYSVSHDLRAPLRRIDGFSQALLEDCFDMLDAQGKGHLQRIRGSVQHMAQLIEDILRLSRVTRGEMRREKVDLSLLAQEVVSQLREAQPERQVDSVIAPGLMVDADAHLLRIVLENLLSNAWKFTSTRPRARIEVGATQRGGLSTYFVRDNGVGFDMAHASKLFASFQRLHTTAEFPGTGIGLALVQRIVSRHGGKVWAEALPEQGASFFFTLH